MDAISPTFRLDHANDLRSIFAGDWDVNEEDHMVSHRRYGLLFIIDYEPAACVSPLALSATLRHVCTGKKMPAPELLRRIAKDAIHAFAAFTEVCHQAVRPRAVLGTCPDDDHDLIPF